MAIVAWLIVRADEPGDRIVQARLRDVDDWHGDSRARARPAIGLPEIGTPRLFDALQLPIGIRQARLREHAVDVASAAFEDAEDVARLHRLPRGQRIELRHDARDGDG